jgi:hypothetical protein
VTSSEPVRVVLELTDSEHTISGRITVDDTPRGDFYGWLELIGRLQRATGVPGAERADEDRGDCTDWRLAEPAEHP